MKSPVLRTLPRAFSVANAAVQGQTLPRQTYQVSDPVESAGEIIQGRLSRTSGRAAGHPGLIEKGVSMGGRTIIAVAVTCRVHVVICSLAATWSWARAIGQAILAEDLLVVPITMATIYGWNRVTDTREDSVNEGAHALRPAAGKGGVSAYYFLGSVAALAVGALRGNALALFHLFLVQALGFAYSGSVCIARGATRLKELFLIKNLTSCLGWSVLTIVYPTLHAGGRMEPVHWCAFGVMFLTVLTVEIVWDIRDREGDRAAGIPTLPVLFGIGTSLRSVRIICIVAGSMILLAIGVGALKPAWVVVLASQVITALWVSGPLAWLALRRTASHVLVSLHTLLLVALGVLIGGPG